MARILIPYLLISLAALPLPAQQTGSSRPSVQVRISGATHQFSRFTFFAASSSGMLAVAQAQDGQVHLFNPDGTAAAIVGRAGSGPGEFRQIRRLGWTGDTLWVVDPATDRLTLVSKRGEVLRMMPLPIRLDDSRLDGAPSGLHRVATVVGRTSDGSLIFLVQRRGNPVISAKSGTVVYESWLIRGDHEGRLEQVVAPDIPDTCSRTSTGAVQVVVLIPLCPAPITEHSSDAGLVALVTMQVNEAGRGSYTVTVRSSDQEIYSRRVELSLVPVPASIRDTLIAQQRRESPEARGLLQGTTIARHYPPVHRIVAGADGGVWVNVRVSGDSTLALWHHFDSRGDGPVAVRLPRGATVFAAESRGLWTTELDSDGIENIVLYARPAHRPRANRGS